MIICYRKSGQKHPVHHRSEKAFFFLHTINAFDVDDDAVVVDVSCYDNPKMLDCMRLEELRKAQSNAEYAKLFRGRPQRFVLPLTKEGAAETASKLAPRSSARLDQDGVWVVKPHQLCDVGCETPTINYNRYKNGHKLVADGRIIFLSREDNILRPKC